MPALVYRLPYPLVPVLTRGDLNPDIAIVTETWLNNEKESEFYGIPGYSMIRKDRENKRGGGIAIYIKTETPYHRWTNIEDNSLETIWKTIRPPRLPRDITNITVIATYHPPQANHRELKEHLSKGIDSVLCKHPASGIFVIGDLNKFPDKSITTHYKMKQVVKSPTRGTNILDKCFTNAS